jgi:hypothetical protein
MSYPSRDAQRMDDPRPAIGIAFQFEQAAFVWGRAITSVLSQKIVE